MADKKPKKQEGVAEEKNETPQERVKKEKKQSRWNLEACMKASSRFVSREEWAQNAPSSYKAAVARGWEAQCTAHMKNLTPITKKKAAEPTRKTPQKKSA